MRISLTEWLIEKLGRWLLQEDPPHRGYLCDFNHICHSVRSVDVLLIEGRSRASKTIKQVTQSPWSHATLYIGTLQEIEDPELQALIKKHCPVANPTTQLLIETEIGFGTMISPITKYQPDHIRILRPRGISHADMQKIISFCILRLGRKYSMRHLFDLARFLFPWGLFPRRWRSSLFQHNAQKPTEDICSSMIADAFHSVNYPILPLVQETSNKDLELVQRNPRLFTPSDFDYSPYFDVLKYPLFPLGKEGDYQNLRWRKDFISNDTGMITPTNELKISDKIAQFLQSTAFAVVGASSDKTKYGNQVLRCYIANNKTVYPVNPREKMVLNIPCFKSVAELPDTVTSISIVTPPKITEQVVNDAIAKGIKNIWLQPGAESMRAIQQCLQHNINIIANGPCILVEMRFKG
jgi:predicted CoA-binding protein